MRLLLPAATAALLLSGCMKAWDLGGPWACSDGACPTGFSCDEGICCVPGGSPSCPTLPFNGQCLDGGFASAFFRDRDGDGEGNPSEPLLRCAQPSGGWVTPQTDCDDTEATVNRSTPELCDGLDNNCDGQWDELLTPAQTFFLDQDGDGYGSATTIACAAPPGYVATGGDCDDAAPGRHPGAPELCDGLNNNCDAFEDNQVADQTSFADVGAAFPCAVQGGQGICATGFNACNAGVRTCVASRTPEHEVCDGLDNNCDGRVDEQPECGGPRQLFGPDTRVSAFWLATTGSLSTRCHTDNVGGAETVSGTTWSAASAGTNFHVLAVEPVDGGTWDLSRLDAKLWLSLTSSTTGWGQGGPGYMGSPSLYDPQVSLCGATPADLVHYRPFVLYDGFADTLSSVAMMMPLNGVSPQWLIAAANGLDSTKVSRVEVLVFNNSGSFSVTFSADAGFIP